MNEYIVWFAPREITFNKEHVKWILEHYWLLKTGTWPNDPRPTGYIGDDSHSTRNGKFCNAIEVVSEIDERLSMLKDGEMLIRLYAGESIDDIPWHIRKITKAYKYPFYFGMKQLLREYLSYICGYKRSIFTFEEWKILRGKYFEMSKKFKTSTPLTNKIESKNE